MGKTIRFNSDNVASMHRSSAMAMEKRHGRHSGQVHKDRRMPRGGTRNTMRDLLDNLSEDSDPMESIPETIAAE